MPLYLVTLRNGDLKRSYTIGADSFEDAFDKVEYDISIQITNFDEDGNACETHLRVPFEHPRTHRNKTKDPYKFDVEDGD